MKHFLIILSLSLTCQADAQNENLKWDNNWVAGSDFGLNGFIFNFNNNELSIDTITVSLNIDRFNLSMSNDEGDLIFYSNGCHILGSDHQMLENGDEFNLFEEDYLAWDAQCDVNIWGGSFYALDNSGIVLPTSDEDISIFHIANEVNPQAFRILQQSRIIKENDQYIVSEKNKIAFDFGDDNFVYSAVGAIRHGNGRDWWLMIPQVTSRLIRQWHVTENGLGQHYTTEGLSQFSWQDIPASQLIFSEDGAKMAVYGAKAHAQVFDFDRCSGDLSNPIQILRPEFNIASGGIAFSPSGQFIYISVESKIWQYDLWSDDIQASVQTVGEYDGFVLDGGWPVLIGRMKLGRDGKIYVTPRNVSTYMHVINQPDSLGIACDFVQRAHNLGNFINQGVPSLPNFRLNAMEGSLCDTITSLNTIIEPLFNVQLSPNPILKNESLQIEMQLEQTQHLRTSLYDLTGRKTKAKTYIATASASTLTMQMPKTAGLYFLSIQNEQGQIVVKKVVVQ